MNLKKLTITQLRRVARKVGIQVTSTDRKSDILKKLMAPLGHYSMIAQTGMIDVFNGEVPEVYRQSYKQALEWILGIIEPMQKGEIQKMPTISEIPDFGLVDTTLKKSVVKSIVQKLKDNGFSFDKRNMSFKNDQAKQNMLDKIRIRILTFNRKTLSAFKERQLFISIFINGKKVVGLLDTGATTSTMPEYMARAIWGDNFCDAGLQKSFSGVLGIAQKCLGTRVVNVDMGVNPIIEGEKEFQMTINISRNTEAPPSPDDFLIGLDFMTIYNGFLHLADDYVIDQKYIDENKPVPYYGKGLYLGSEDGEGPWWFINFIPKEIAYRRHAELIFQR